jgi:hypothetical protein
MTVHSAEHYIFYMRYSKKLNKDFFVFHSFFQKYGVKLVPIYPKQMPELIKGKAPFIISIVKDLQSKSVFDSFRKKFLDYALVSGSLTVYEITSFSKMILCKRPSGDVNYYSFKLPQSFEELSNQILFKYFTKKKISKKWPGGKRATLPQS